VRRDLALKAIFFYFLNCAIGIVTAVSPSTPAALHQEVDRAAQPGALTMGRVLYLDDDESLASLLCQKLEGLGHTVVTCTDATKALKAFKRDPDGFALVLTDMSMPGTSGLEFAGEVLKARPTARVVIATGCEDPNWAQFARSTGVHQVVEKPRQVAVFAEMISRLLGR
jgi:DNA-binding NtrC family response regulator